MVGFLGWVLAQGMQWVIGFIGVLMFAAAALGLGWSVIFLYDNAHRLFNRAKIRRRRRYNG